MTHLVRSRAARVVATYTISHVVAAVFIALSSPESSYEMKTTPPYAAKEK